MVSKPTLRLLPRNKLSFRTSACATRLGSTNSTYAYLQTPISVPSLAADLLPGSEDFAGGTGKTDKEVLREGKSIAWKK